MAAMGTEIYQDVKDTPLKPKLAAVAASRAVEFDIYSPPSVKDASMKTESPAPRSQGFNERFGLKTTTPTQGNYVSPKGAIVRVESAQTPSIPPGIPVTWSTSKSTSSTTIPPQVEEGSRQEREPMHDFMSKMRVMFADVKKKPTAQTPTQTSQN